jgi:16S rRNA (guanine527-N7)-methyltransferase
MPQFQELFSLLDRYFPGELSSDQKDQFQRAFDAYLKWNPLINVVSRKDIENLAERHFLHSLAIAKSIRFVPGTTVLDAGTGGGFPGIPLAILFPQTQFMLVDSRQKKIQVVEEVAREAGLQNVQWSVQRVEQLTGQFDFVVSRAVTSLDEFIPWVKKRIHCRNKNSLANGILYLRGGGFEEELNSKVLEKPQWTATPLADWYSEEFFASKFLVHVTYCGGR